MYFAHSVGDYRIYQGGCFKLYFCCFLRNRAVGVEYTIGNSGRWYPGARSLYMTALEFYLKVLPACSRLLDFALPVFSAVLYSEDVYAEHATRACQ